MDKVVAALENRTVAQIAEIRASYWDHEGRNLDDDLFSPDKGGTNLSIPDHARIKALLRGTSADSGVATAGGMASTLLSAVGMSADEAAVMGASFAKAAVEHSQEQAADTRAEATAAELRKLLTDDPNEAERERIMALLRNQPATNGTIAGHYRRLFTDDLYADLRKHLKAADAERAEKLVIGDRNTADALAVKQRLDAIAALNRQIDVQDALIKGQEDAGGGLLDAASAIVGSATSSVMTTAQKAKFEQQRREQVAAMEELLDKARQEAAGLAAPGEAMAAGAARVRAILATPVPGGTRLGDRVTAIVPHDAAMVVAAMAAGSPPDLAAARLYQAYGTPAMKATLIESELLGLRTQAATDAQQDLLGQLRELLPHLGPQERAAAADSMQAALPAAIRAHTEAYFVRLRDSFTAKITTPGGVNRFDALLAHWDSEGSTSKLTELFAGRGALGEGAAGDLRELQLALGGSHDDIATVKRVLTGKKREEIDQLVAAYDRVPGVVPLRRALFGRPATETESKLDTAASVLGIGVGGGVSSGLVLKAITAGKASGHDAFVLRELLDVPAEMGGATEAEFLRKQTQKERDWGVSDAGNWGKVYDWTGNEAKDLMDETADTAGVDLRIYQSAVASGRKEDADRALADLRRDRARMRLDRAAYSDTIEKFRSQLATALSIAVDIAIMVVLPEAAPFLLGVAASAAGHIAANVIAYGDKYSGDMLKNDLLGAVGSAGAAKLANLALVGRAAGSTLTVAEEMSAQLAVTASKTIAKEAGAYSSSSILALAKQQAKALAVEALENTAGVAGAVAATGHGDVSAKDVAMGIAMGRVGRIGKGGHVTAEGSTPGPEPVPGHPAPEPGHPGPDHPGPSHPAPDHPDPAHPAPEHPAGEEHPASERKAAAGDAHSRPTKEYPAAKLPDDVVEMAGGKLTAEQERAVRRDLEIRGMDPEMNQTDVRPVDAGDAFQASDPNSEFETWRIYARLRASDPHREVGMIWNHKRKQWAAVQGGPRRRRSARRGGNWGGIPRTPPSAPTSIRSRKGRGRRPTSISSPARRTCPAWRPTRPWVRPTGPRAGKRSTSPSNAGRASHRRRIAPGCSTIPRPEPGPSFIPCRVPHVAAAGITVTDKNMYRRWRASNLERGPGGKLSMKDTGRLVEPGKGSGPGEQEHGSSRRSEDEPGSLFDPSDPEWNRRDGWRLPAEHKGSWEPPNSPGDGWWTPHDPGAYGLEHGARVRFREGVPDFTGHLVETPSGHPGSIEVDGLTGNTRDTQLNPSDRRLTIEALARREGCRYEDMERWLREAGLRLHHQAGDTMQIVPGPLHNALGHQGSATAKRGD